MALEDIKNQTLTARANLVNAIRSKGVEIADDSTINQCATAITMIQSTGSSGEAYVAVEENGELKLQKLSFNGTEATPDGATETMLEVGLFPTGMDEPAYAGSGGGGGGGSAKYYKCASVDTASKTWSGKELVLTDGVYVVSDTETTGLTFNLGYSYTPEIGTVYSEDCLVEVNRVYIGDPSTIPLTLTAEEAGSTVTLNASGSPTTSGLMYSTDGSTWNAYTCGTTVTLASAGDYVQFKNTEETLGLTDNVNCQFVMSGKIAASGNIQSMLNFIDTCPDYSFYELFKNCTSLTSAPDMPATSVGIFSCLQMYYGCTNLQKAPDLVATELGEFCYYYMFYGCNSLSSIKVSFTSWDAASRAFESWVTDVASTGTFYKPSALPEEYGTSRIPEGWTVVNIDEATA